MHGAFSSANCTIAKTCLQILQLLIDKVLLPSPRARTAFTNCVGGDIGYVFLNFNSYFHSTQYRSAIFTYSPEQKQTAHKVLDEVQEKYFKGQKIVVCRRHNSP
jgi:hypothetical protein